MYIFLLMCVLFSSLLAHNVPWQEEFDKIIIQVNGVFNYVLGYEAEKSIEEEVSFYLYTKNTSCGDRKIPMGNASTLISSNFNPRRRTIFIIHGYVGNKDRSLIVQLRKEILNTLDVNVFVVDWEDPAGLIYFNAASAAIRVGKYLAIFLEYLTTQNVKLEDVHLIGHSLGAHIAGVAGAHVNSKVGRITGLDPAGPLFEHISKRGKSESLDKKDAIFVDVIHTAIGEMGVRRPSGHVDFYPNKGYSQPGCNMILTSALCGHRRSLDYFIESINSTFNFVGYRCEYLIPGGLWKCYLNQTSVMGYHTPNGVTGLYYLPLNSESPFSRTTHIIKYKVFHARQYSIEEVKERM